MSEIRTYMSITYPVDPTRIETIPDMNISNALASTLVEWDKKKAMAPGLAISWKIIGNTYRLKLRNNLKWSNGDPLTSTQVKKCLERGFALYPKELRSLTQMLHSLGTPSDQEIDFNLKGPAGESGLLGKLTESNFSISYVTDAGGLDLTKTSGPYSLIQNTPDELVMVQSPYWFGFHKDGAKKIKIRNTPKGSDSQTVLFTDTWPNLIETSSLIPEALTDKYVSEKFQVWKRPYDKVVVLEVGLSNRNTEGFEWMKRLREGLNRTVLTDGLSGYLIAQQMFPPGYHLHATDFACETNTSSANPGRPLQILTAEGRISPRLKENLKKTIYDLFGHEPIFSSVPLNRVFETKKAGQHDLYFGNFGLADPDPEGVMSYYLETIPPVIPSGTTEQTRFISRLDQARKEPDFMKRVVLMQNILKDAVCGGHILPLLHISTVGLARPELDLSHVPQSDESVTLSEIRISQGHRE